MQLFIYQKTKGRGLTQPNDKNPYIYRKNLKTNVKQKNRKTEKNFDYTTIADQLRTFSLSKRTRKRSDSVCDKNPYTQRKVQKET